MEEKANYTPFVIAVIVAIVVFVILVMINLVLGGVALFSPLLGLWRLVTFAVISIMAGAIVFLFAWVIGLSEQVEELKSEVEDLKTRRTTEEQSRFSTRKQEV